MRKLFFAMVAMAALLASCSKDEGITGVSKSKVTFTVSSPELTTRADYGEGQRARDLYYAVYDAVEGGLVEGLSITHPKTPMELDAEGKATVELALVEGRTYDIIFYAEHADAPYALEWKAQTLSLDPAVLLKSNQETYDAFYAHVDGLKVGKEAIEETVFLKRPFAQLNILTTKKDFEDGEKAGINIDKTAVTVDKIYTKMNLFTDQVDYTTERSVTFDLAEVLTDKVNKDGSDVTSTDTDYYHWLSMNYLLVNEKKMVDVTFTMEDKTVAAGQDATLVRTYPSVHVERNHRTNIYGSIITNPAKFNVEILPDFITPDYNIDADNIEEKSVATAAELQAAIDAATTGRTVIKFEQDINAESTRSTIAAPITIVQKEGVDLVIDGCGFEFDGTFKVHGNSAYRNATLDFVNINFKTSTAGLNFIHAVDFGKDSNGNTQRYSQNITVSDCTFEAVSGSEAENTAVALQVNATKNLLVLNCTATNMHSFIQATASDNITIDGIKVNGKKNGVSFGTSTNVTVRNSNIEVSGYGIRTANKDTANNVDVTLENNTIKAELPVVARYMAGNNDNVAMTFKGTNTLTATNSYGYQVVFTAGDDGTYVMPAAETTINLTGADDYYVYPRDWVDLSQTFTGEITAEGDKPAIYVSAGVTKDDLATVELEEGTPVPAICVQDATIKGNVGIDSDSSLATIYVNNVVFDCITAIEAPVNATICAIGCDFIVPEGGQICPTTTGVLMIRNCKINGEPATASEISALCGGISVFDI